MNWQVRSASRNSEVTLEQRWSNACAATKTLATTLLLGLFLTACATGPRTPVVDYRHDYDFSNVKTLAFYKDSGKVSGDNPMQLSDMQRDRLTNALSHALTARGFEIIDNPRDADLLVSWHLVTQHQTDVHQTGNFGFGLGYGFHRGYFGYGPYAGYGPYDPFACEYYGGYRDVFVQNYTQGKFIVDMIDPTTDKSVWRTVSESRLRDDPTIEQEKYNQTATYLFSTFPPQQ